MDTPYPRHIRFVAAFLAAIGAWYAVFGVYVLANLSSVTHEWIVAAGDPDFLADFDMFAGYAGIFTVCVILLGVLTVIYSGGILARRQWASSPAWLGLTLFAVAVHALRLPIRALSRTLTWPGVVWFVIVCAAYATVWLAVKRRLDSPSHVGSGTGTWEPEPRNGTGEPELRNQEPGTRNLFPTSAH